MQMVVLKVNHFGIRFNVLLLLLIVLGELCVVLTSAANSPQFMIGNLLPDLDNGRSFMMLGGDGGGGGKNSTTNRSLSPLSKITNADRGTCPSKLSSVLFAIDFASQKLSQMFLELYRCNFSLNPANTNVRK